jgi:hypothetical protein
MHPVNILRIFAFNLVLGGIQILTIHYFNSFWVFWDTLFTVGGLLSLIAVQPNIQKLKIYCMLHVNKLTM